MPLRREFQQTPRTARAGAGWCKAREAFMTIFRLLDERKINKLMTQFVQEVRGQDGNKLPFIVTELHCFSCSVLLAGEWTPAIVCFYDEKNNTHV